MLDPQKPFSPSCERNKHPICDALTTRIQANARVLEIGSGTGQHAVHFAAAMPTVTWQCSERPPELPGLNQWLNEAALANTPTPISLRITANWSQALREDNLSFDTVFSANTLHIMHWPEVCQLFSEVKKILNSGGKLITYGPYNYNGQFSSPSNAEFDQWLKERDPGMGIRDLADLQAIAEQVSLSHLETVDLPANNQLQVWRFDS